jgi:hypothetical protein
MTRWVSGSNATAAAAANTPLRLLADLNFSGGYVYAHAGQGELVANGNTYLGLGMYGGFDQVIEQSGVIARPVTLKLGGVPNDLIYDAMSTVYQGRSITLWIGILNDAGGWIAAPETLWSGVMDTMTIDIGFGTSSITLVCEDPDYATPIGRRYTQTDLQLDYPTDTGLAYMPAIPGFRGNWGQGGMGFGNIGNSVGLLNRPAPPFDPGNFLKGWHW